MQQSSLCKRMCVTSMYTANVFLKSLFLDLYYQIPSNIYDDSYIFHIYFIFFIFF